MSELYKGSVVNFRHMHRWGPQELWENEVKNTVKGKCVPNRRIWSFLSSWDVSGDTVKYAASGLRNK